jgi:hypothetical protein
MAISHSVTRDEWPPFFDRVSSVLQGQRAEIEAASLELGDQIIAEWLPLLGVSYDSADDLLDLSLVGLDHLIRSPRYISYWEGDRGIETIAVMAQDGVKETLRFRPPVMLPVTTM